MWLRAARELRLSHASDTYIHIRISRNVSIAMLVSVLVHLLLLFFLSRQDLLNQGAPTTSQSPPIVVRLNPRVPVQQPAMPPPEMLPAPASPPRQMAKPKVVPPRLALPNLPNTLPIPAVPAPMPQPVPPEPRPSATSKPAPLDPKQFPDMAAYLNAVRERRRLSGEDADRVNEEAVRAEEEARVASKPKAQSSGTNGIFQILSMDNRTASFAFRGWKNEFSYSHREVYEVSAGPDGDVARATVRKMIEIIRRYYNEDFNWESYRLGRVVVLSARPQDSAGLEDFMMQEFFGGRGGSAR